MCREMTGQDRTGKERKKKKTCDKASYSRLAA
jgi:hypothetical protein